MAYPCKAPVLAPQQRAALKCVRCRLASVASSGRYSVSAAAQVLLLFALGGCPSQVPAATNFAGVDAHTATADTAVIGDTSTQSNDITGETSSFGSAGNDTAGPEVATANPSAAVCAVTGGIGLFTKTIDNGANDLFAGLAPSGDGGGILVGKSGNAGSQTDVWAVRVSALGAKLWSKTYGEAAEDAGRAAIATGGGFAFAGLTHSKGAGNADGWLLRSDADGKLVWDKVFGGTSVDEFSAIAVTKNGGFVLAGSTRSTASGLADGWLVVTDADGNPLWQNHYGGSQIDELFSVVVLADGRIAAAGSSTSQSAGGSDAWLLVVDAKGKQVVSKLISGGDTDEARSLAITGDGGLVVTGTAGVKGNPELWTFKTDSEGNLGWQDIVSGNQGEVGRGVAVGPQGAIWVVGETNSPHKGNTSLGYDGWLLRYDNWGNRLWDQRLGSNGNEWLTAVVALPAQPDWGVLVAGRQFTNSSSSFDGWLLRLDPWGHANCATIGNCKTKTAAECDDNAACTADRCDSIDGCTHTLLAPQSPCGKSGVCTGSTCMGN